VIPDKYVHEGMNGPHKSLAILVIGRNCMTNKFFFFSSSFHIDQDVLYTYMDFRHARRELIVLHVLLLVTVGNTRNLFELTR
jgi:hypothetical protein